MADLGVTAQAMAGHSFGGTALCAAGNADTDLVKMARKRGELMNDAATTWRKLAQLAH